VLALPSPPSYSFLLGFFGMELLWGSAVRFFVLHDPGVSAIPLPPAPAFDWNLLRRTIGFLSAPAPCQWFLSVGNGIAASPHIGRPFRSALCLLGFAGSLSASPISNRCQLLREVLLPAAVHNAPYAATP